MTKNAKKLKFLTLISALSFFMGALLTFVAAAFGVLTRLSSYLKLTGKINMHSMYSAILRSFGIIGSLLLVVFAIGSLLIINKKKTGFKIAKFSIGAFTALFSLFLISLTVYNFSTAMMSIALTRDYTAGTPLLISVVILVALTILLFVFCSKSYRMTERLQFMLESGSEMTISSAYTDAMLIFGTVALIASVFTGGRVISNIAAIVLALANILLVSVLISIDKKAVKSTEITTSRLYMLEQMRAKKE